MKMPPRIKVGDGSYDEFIRIFLEINVARDGFVTRNELAHHLGVESKEVHSFDRVKQLRNAVFGFKV